jgi:SAM-dependent methyltransferase
MTSVAPDTDLDQFAEAYKPAAIYALDNELILNWYPHRIIEQVRGGSLLELGVGHGYATRLLNGHFDRHVIVDGSAAVIAQFRAQNPELNLDLVESYFEAFETSERFDTICMGFILEHVDDPGLILERFRRFLAPGGSIFVTVPNAESMHRRVGKAAGLMTDLFALGEGDRQFGHQQLFSVETMNALLDRCGYQPLGSEGLFFKPFTTAQIEKLSLSPEVLQGLMRVGIDYPELCCAFMTRACLKA